MMVFRVLLAMDGTEWNGMAAAATAAVVVIIVVAATDVAAAVINTITTFYFAFDFGNENFYFHLI